METARRLSSRDPTDLDGTGNPPCRGLGGRSAGINRDRVAWPMPGDASRRRLRVGRWRPDRRGTSRIRISGEEVRVLWSAPAMGTGTDPAVTRGRHESPGRPDLRGTGAPSRPRDRPERCADRFGRAQRGDGDEHHYRLGARSLRGRVPVGGGPGADPGGSVGDRRAPGRPVWLDGGLRDGGVGPGGGAAGMRRGVLGGSDVRPVRGVCGGPGCGQHGGWVGGVVLVVGRGPTGGGWGVQFAGRGFGLHRPGVGVQRPGGGGRAGPRPGGTSGGPGGSSGGGLRSRRS